MNNKMNNNMNMKQDMKIFENFVFNSAQKIVAEFEDRKYHLFRAVLAFKPADEIEFIIAVEFYDKLDDIERIKLAINNQIEWVELGDVNPFVYLLSKSVASKHNRQDLMLEIEMMGLGDPSERALKLVKEALGKVNWSRVVEIIHNLREFDEHSDCSPI